MNSQPYPPSFVDRLMDSVQRLPIPYLLTYCLLFVFESTLFHIVAWVDGWLPAYRLSGFALMYPLWLWGPLAIMTYLNSVSLEALASFRPLMDIPDETMRRVKYEFTTMPARGVLISGAVWTIVYVVFNYLALDTMYAAYGFGTLIEVSSFVGGWISFFVGSAIYYHTIRQLRLVNRTVSMVKQFDLFQLEPVYAFSALTSRTGVSWVILLSLTLLIVPIQAAPFPTLALLIVQLVLAIAAFALPLQMVNSCLVSEKRRLMAELDQRVKGTLASLHRCLDDNALAEVAQLNSAIVGLTAERDILTKIPTWPWRAGMFTGFLSIIVLPIMLFILQFVLARWFGS
ncbi:MAG TPA: hypothetical protein VJK02_20675 [Anaerolineales bacterium]|nr:hypothetical protein [Anaerolineales bacterium]